MLYLTEGDYINAGLSALSIIPGADAFTKTGKASKVLGNGIVESGLKHLDNVADGIKKLVKKADDAIDLEKHLPKKLLTEEAETFAKKVDKVADDVVEDAAKSIKSGSETSRTNWGAEHGKGNVKHNNAIETELDNAASNGATDIRKNRVQRDSNGNRVYAPDGKYTKPDASYVIDGQRYNTNYVSNYGLDNIDELNRKIEAFNRMCDADPDSITQLIFKY